MYWGVGGNEAKMEEGTHVYQKRGSKTKKLSGWGGWVMRQNCKGGVDTRKRVQRKKSGGEYNVGKLLV